MPGCGKKFDTRELLTTDPDIIDTVLRDHMNDAHPGWTIEELTRAFNLYQIREAFKPLT